MKRLLRTAMALGWCLVGARQVSAGALYTQPWYGSYGAYASQNDTNSLGNFATAYDDFTLSTSAAVYNVQWTGEFFNPVIHGTVTQFTLKFWSSDGSGQPAVALQTETVLGTANETHLTDASFIPVYTYSAGLSSPFSASGGTQYWLSIVPDLGYPPQWYWSVGTGGDGSFYQDFSGTRSRVRGDLAFTLSTPEPGTCTLLGIGLVAIVRSSRRRRRSAA